MLLSHPYCDALEQNINGTDELTLRHWCSRRLGEQFLNTQNENEKKKKKKRRVSKT
jgi:hypothetical protein